MELQHDFREFIASFLSHKVEFLLVGVYALAFSLGTFKVLATS